MEDTDQGVILHPFSGYAGYGSIFDGEEFNLYFCSECLDRMLMNRPKTNDINS